MRDRIFRKREQPFCSSRFVRPLVLGPLVDRRSLQQGLEGPGGSIRNNTIPNKVGKVVVKTPQLFVSNQLFVPNTVLVMCRMVRYSCFSCTVPYEYSYHDNVSSQMLFVFRRASRPWLFCLSRFRGLPQDVAVPSRFRRRESPETIQIKKLTVSYDFSQINMPERRRLKSGGCRIYGLPKKSFLSRTSLS